MMEDNGAFIKNLFRKQSAINILALLASTIGPIVCASLAGTFYGSGGLAITALCSPLFLSAAFFGFIIAGGAQIVCSGYIAKDELESVDKIFSAAVALILIADALVFAVLIIFKRPILTFMANEISPELSAYYTYFAIYAFATMLIYIPLFFSKVAGHPEIGLYLTGIMSVVSIAASLILTKFMGIEAIALGQALGTAAGLAVSMAMLMKHFRLIFPKKLFIIPIFTSGSPLGLTRLYILLSTLILNALFLRTGGSGALAVFGVVSMVHRFNTAFIVGISQTIVPFVGVFYEEQDTTSIKQTMKTALLYGNTLILIFGLLLFVFKSQTGAVFGLTDNDLLNTAIPFYVIYAFLLQNTTIFSSYYNATKMLWLANIIAFMQEFALLCSGGILLSKVFGVNGIWLAYPVSGIGTVLILCVIWGVVKIVRKELTIPLFLNRRLEKDGKYTSFSVDASPEKASEAAEKINIFCEESGVNPKQTMQISMSIEEIITLIINNNKKKNFSVSVRLFLLDDVIVLRIRNAGEKFDAIEYYKTHIADDIEKSLDIIGMKYIVQTASVIFYRQTFGVNNLVIII